MVSQHPGNADLLVARAGLELEMGQMEVALFDLDSALGLSPSDAGIYVMRGNIYLLKKEKELAKSDFEKAISLGYPRRELHSQLEECR